MEREDGRGIGKEALEERRKTIVRMRKAGNTYAEIVIATGASMSAAFRIWVMADI